MVVVAVNGGEIVARLRLKPGITSAIRVSGLNFENVLFRKHCLFLRV